MDEKVDGRLDEVEKKAGIHQEKIEGLENFRKQHEKKHETQDKEHIVNTAKLQYIENALKWVLGIVVGSVILKILEMIK